MQLSAIALLLLPLLSASGINTHDDKPILVDDILNVPPNEDFKAKMNTHDHKPIIVDDILNVPPNEDFKAKINTHDHKPIIVDDILNVPPNEDFKAKVTAAATTKVDQEHHSTAITEPGISKKTDYKLHEQAKSEPGTKISTSTSHIANMHNEVSKGDLGDKKLASTVEAHLNTDKAHSKTLGHSIPNPVGNQIHEKEKIAENPKNHTVGSVLKGTHPLQTPVQPSKNGGAAQVSLKEIVEISTKIWKHPNEWYAILFGNKKAYYPEPNFSELNIEARMNALNSVIEKNHNPSLNGDKHPTMVDHHHTLDGMKVSEPHKLGHDGHHPTISPAHSALSAPGSHHHASNSNTPHSIPHELNHIVQQLSTITPTMVNTHEPHHKAPFNDVHQHTTSNLVVQKANSHELHHNERLHDVNQHPANNITPPKVYSPELHPTAPVHDAAHQHTATNINAPNVKSHELYHKEPMRKEFRMDHSIYGSQADGANFQKQPKDRAFSGDHLLYHKHNESDNSPTATRFRHSTLNTRSGIGSADLGTSKPSGFAHRMPIEQEAPSRKIFILSRSRLTTL